MDSHARRFRRFTKLTRDELPSLRSRHSLVLFVAMVSVAGVVVYMWSTYFPHSVVNLVFFGVPYLCFWFFGALWTRDARWRVLIIAYAVPSILLHSWMLDDMIRSRCAFAINLWIWYLFPPILLLCVRCAVLGCKALYGLARSVLGRSHS